MLFDSEPLIDKEPRKVGEDRVDGSCRGTIYMANMLTIPSL